VTLLEPGTTFAGKYLIDGTLGKGGMGAVYSATNQAIGRRVAIKVLIADLAEREDVKERFALEAKAAGLINHPGIVDVLDMGETSDGEPFIVMEHLDGATLKAVFKKHGVFSPAEAVGIIAPLLDALAAAHTANVIHRDIKPANIFLCTRPQRQVKLLDFGISRFGSSTGLTHSGTAVGTPKYMAPEQVMGEKGIGPGADIYSVGAVLYELLGGRAPFDADSDIATLARMLKESHEPLQQVRADLPPKLCVAVDALLAKQPAERPHDAAAVKAQLVALVKPTELSSLYDLAQEAAPRTNTAGTPRPPTGPARLPTVNARRAATPKTPSPAQTVDEEPPAPKPSTGRRPPPARRADELPASRRSATSLEPTVEPEPPRQAKLPLAVVAVAVVGLLVGGGLFFLLGTDGTATPEVVTASSPVVGTPPAELGLKDVALTLRAEPAEARFEVDGLRLEGNPASLTRRQHAQVEVVASAPGFQARRVRLVFEEPHEERLTLLPIAAAATEQPPTRPAKAPSKPAPVKKGKLTVDEANPYE